jgi:CO/xanthine dehydrogenase Mo-binding subunit
VVDGTPIEDASTDPLRPAGGWMHEASYSRPYLMHGSIGPAAAVTLWEDDRLSVWTSSQSVFSLRTALAGTLGLPIEQIRVRHVVGSGCYGHNGADDVALDCALLAMSVPGRTVRLQWSRSDEHQWEPYGAPAVVDLRATVGGDGRIVDWSHDVWGTTHLSRPTSGGAPNLLAGPHLEPPVASATPRPALGKEVGIHRNATPIYDLPRQRIVKHFVAAMPLRTSSLRSLGAHANVFAIESFMDELAMRVRANPIEFRLRHLSDERARDVLRTAVDAAGWDGTPSTTFGNGTGVALARYKNRAGYAAVVVRLHVDDATSRIVVDDVTIAADCGEVIDPRGLANQVEGGALQAISWTLHERVAYDETMVTSVDWETYPILRFGEVPRVETVLLDRPGLPYLGAGEITQGPTAGAIANAVFDAIGFRLRDMPLTPDAVRRAAATGDSAWDAVRLNV